MNDAVCSGDDGFSLTRADRQATRFPWNFKSAWLGWGDVSRERAMWGQGRAQTKAQKLGLVEEPCIDKIDPC